MVRGLSDFHPRFLCRNFVSSVVPVKGFQGSLDQYSVQVFLIGLDTCSTLNTQKKEQAPVPMWELGITQFNFLPTAPVTVTVQVEALAHLYDESSRSPQMCIPTMGTSGLWDAGLSTSLDR